MANRQGSMAAINAALLQGPLPAGGSSSQGQPSVVAPHPAPGVNAPTAVSSIGTLTSDQKRFIDAQRQAQTDEEKQAQNLANEQRANEDAFVTSSNATVSALQQIAKGTGVSLAGLPTPGSILLPLVILLVFFFLLLPVNGHTRLVWLWLTLTGNAEIGQDSTSSSGAGFSGGAGGTFSATIPTTPPASNGASQSTVNLSQLVTMTGAEDL